jgi:hypothetical protein
VPIQSKPSHVRFKVGINFANNIQEFSLKNFAVPSNPMFANGDYKIIYSLSDENKLAYLNVTITATKV